MTRNAGINILRKCEYHCSWPNEVWMKKRWFYVIEVIVIVGLDYSENRSQAA